MQKMPMPKVPAQGSITDKKKKQPLPVRPMPKQVPGGMVKKYKGGGVLDQMKKLAPGSARNQMKQGLVQGLNNLKSKKTLQGSKNANPRGGSIQKAGPRGGSIQKAGPRGGSVGIGNLYSKTKGNLKKIAPRGLAPRGSGKTRPVQPRRGSR
jgi:hypothetical protein